MPNADLFPRLYASARAAGLSDTEAYAAAKLREREIIEAENAASVQTMAPLFQRLAQIAEA